MANQLNLLLTFDVTGSLPSALSNLTNSQIVLAENDFTGAIPVSIGKNYNEHIWMDDNELTGGVPLSLSKFRSVSLTHNYLSSFAQIGALPRRSVSSLERIDLSYNLFRDPLPSWLASIDSLTDVNLAGNQITGVVTYPLPQKTL